MLQLTDNATHVIEALTDRPELPDGAGLRISTAGAQDGQLALATTPVPDGADRVIEEQGARVFLDEGAAAILEDKVLDAQVDDQGGVQFLVASQS